MIEKRTPGAEVSIEDCSLTCEESTEENLDLDEIESSNVSDPVVEVGANTYCLSCFLIVILIAIELQAKIARIN